MEKMETQIKTEELELLIRNISLTYEKEDEISYFDEYDIPVYKKDLEKKSSIKRLENFLKR